MGEKEEEGERKKLRMARQLFIQKQVETSDFKSHTKSIHLEVGGLGERFMLRHVFVIFIKRYILLM